MEHETDRAVELRRNCEDLVNTIDGVVWESEIGVSPYTFISAQAEKLFGYPIGRWLTEPGFWQSLLHPEDRAKLTGSRHVSRTEKKDLLQEYRMITADGSTVWIKDSVTVIFENGKPSKLRGIMIDCTERKRVEAEMIAARESALKAARVKADFLANMSHEIRTPLNAVIGMTSLLLDTRLSRSQKESLEVVKRSADGLLAVINEILDFSKIEAGQLKLELLDFSLSDLLKDACGVVKIQAAEKRIHVVIRIDDGLPTSLRGDAGRLLQVLINLLGNAIKFTAKGTVTLSVLPDCLTGSQRVRFQVADTGIGISSELLSKLFNPFTQGDNSTARRYGGTGLGLSICKRLVELMKGEIGVESVEGVGSTFWFAVPLEPARAEAGSTRKKGLGQAPRRRKRRVGTGARILVAEDNAANQKVLLRLLEKLGYRADAVGNGLEVLRALEQRLYDLILMDCQMPEMDGYETTQRVRAREKNMNQARIPILALTAHALSGDRDRCMESGMDDYLSKPIDFDVLEATLSEFTIRSRKKASNTQHTSTRAEHPACIDPAHIAALESLSMPGKPDIVLEVIEVFMTSAPEKALNVKRALALRDLKAAAQEAHSLKSTCYSVGARAMAAACGEIERLASETGPTVALEDALNSMEQEHLKARQELQRLRRGTHATHLAG